MTSKRRKVRRKRKDPTEVEYEDIEDFLATDDLFVEYFNAFLALPTFPAPLCFNKETGGFEVVTDAKKELAKQIKAAIRSQKRIPKIYHPVKHHSYAPIPLIPIEEPEGPEDLEINTSFTVTTLNKEQGIHWIKEERLPAFLESKYYMEYRLGKLISQARVVGEKGDYVLMTIDYKPKSKIRRKKSVHEEPVVDPKEQMMKNMYVCMGATSTTDADAWFTHAQISHNTEPTYSTVGRPKSADIARRPNSARPVSAYSTMDSYRRPGSGVAASIRSSVYSGYYSKTSAESEDDVYSSKLFATDGKPMIHKPSESIFAVTEDFTSKHSRPFSGIMYTGPKVDPIEVDDESGLDVTDTDSNASKDRQDDFLDEDVSVKGDRSRKESMDSIVFKNIDDIGAVVVRAVLARSISLLTARDEKDILHDREIVKRLPDTVYNDITVECFDKISLLEESEPILPEEEEKEVEEKAEDKSKDNNKKKDDESDADSLLDSEDDYEESDTFFRKHKSKTYSLTKRSGIEQFKLFLEGTAGERNWQLWLDIDRLKWMSSQDSRSIDPHTKELQIQQYLNYLREQFYKPGAHYELSIEQKTELGLSEPTSWTVEKLVQIHNKVAEPLVLYWAPRFILKQMQKSEPEKNHLYHNLRQMKSSDGAYPSPATASLLPLRPKSCMPRIKETQVNLEPPSIKPPPSIISSSLPITSPPVGQRRTYAPSSLVSYAGLKTKQEQKRKKLLSTEFTVTKETKPRIKSAPSRSSASGSRPVSARPLSARTTTPASSHKSTQDVSRPSSAGSNSSGRESNASSVFFGGKRMEALLKALHYEREAGGFFQKYVERSGNKLWINCLTFWKAVQQYHLLFYAEVIDSYVADKKARSIHAQYIVVGGPKNIGCSHETRVEIYKRLDPPFEELFDDAEEYSLSVLYLAWVQMVSVDMKTYGKIELIEVKRHLETRSKYVLNLQKRGLIKERVLTPEDPMEGYEDPVYDETLIDKIPEEFRDYTLEKLVHNRIEVDNFKQFLAENYASMDLLCWMDIEHFRRMPQNDEKKRDEKAKEIKTKYLNKKYFFGPNSPAGKEGQDKVMAAGGGYGKLLEDRPPNPIILEAQKYVRDRLEKKWLPLFLATPEFAERQKPKAGMDDVVDDVMVQKKKKSQAVWKMLENKWVSSSKDIITFRKALLNPVTSLQFQRYVSIQGDNLENDVLFWLEVQKFKDLYHTHSEDSLITRKVQSIIGCFVESTIPPSLQIDIHPEMAEKIVDRKFERSPYIFREAQLTVFKVLFSHWNDFINFRSNLADEKVLPTIERRRRHAKMKERLKMKELEEKAQKPVVIKHKKNKKGFPRFAKRFVTSDNKQTPPLIYSKQPEDIVLGHDLLQHLQLELCQEAERRAALGLPPEGEDDDNFHDPFGLGHAPSQDDEEEITHSGDKNKISWSYSSYMSALQTEDILNNTDESTFNSLMSDTASLRESEAGEKESVAATVTDKQSDSTAVKKDVKSEHTQTDKKKSVRMSPTEDTISPEPIKGALKKKGREGSGKRQTVEFSKIEEETDGSSSKSVSMKVKIKT